MDIIRRKYKNQDVELLLRDDKEFLYFPREVEMDMEAYKLYEKALQIDRELDNREPADGELDKMLDMYEEAFSRGIVRAGVNVLRYYMNEALCMTDSEMTIDLKRKDSFLDYVEDLIVELTLFGDPAGKYYQVIFDHYIFCNLRNSGWGNVFFRRMEELEKNEDNMYASWLGDKAKELSKEEQAETDPVKKEAFSFHVIKKEH